MTLARSAAAALIVALSGAACASTPESYYVRVAEGLTAPSLGEGIRVAPRFMSAPELVDACEQPRIVDRLETPSSSLDLRVGERFDLRALSVVAVNAADQAMSDVPIAIEAEDASPAVLQLRSDDPDLNAGRIYALNAGTFRMRIRTMCGIRPAERIITARVLP